MKSRILGLLLALCIVIGVVGITPSAAAADVLDGLNVLYIPIDNRPYNYDRIELLAQSLEFNLMIPEEEWCSTKLDGQKLNENGTQYGDRGKLVQWLMDNASDADVFVICMDQLLSGGLMNSRCMNEMSPIELPDGTTMTEYDVIDYIAGISEDRPVYILDSLMRFATSNEYDGFDLTDYLITRKYGFVDRVVLEGQELNVENIIANYNVSYDGTPAHLKADLSEAELLHLLGSRAPEEDIAVENSIVRSYLCREDIVENVFAEKHAAVCAYSNENSDINVGESSVYKREGAIPDDSLLAEYLLCRERKLRLLDYSIEKLADKDNIRYLLGVDDSSGGNSIQTNEITYLSTKLDENDEVFSTVDGLVQSAFADIYRTICYDEPISYAVNYFGGDPDTVPDYNFLTVRQLIEHAVAYQNGTLTEDVPDIDVLVYMGSGDQNSDALLCQLISRVNENEVNHIPTIIIDYSPKTDVRLKTLLSDNTHLGMLLSYSGCIEGVTCVNMAISQGTARYMHLMNSASADDSSHEAFLKSLAWSLIDEYNYVYGGTDEMFTYLDGLGIGQNFKDISDETLSTVNDKLTEVVKIHAEQVLKNLSRSNYIVSLAPYTQKAVTSVEIGGCEYPWLRQFEMGFRLDVQVSDSLNEVSNVHLRYIDGMPDGNFYPGSFLTREQAAKMLVNLAGVSVGTDMECVFDDVSEWARPYVGIAYEKGYLKGYTDNTFKGGNNITRAEFATMLMQYLNAENISLQPVSEISFLDVDKDSGQWFVGPIYDLGEAGVILGYTDGSFRPHDMINRAEALTMLDRVFMRGETLSSSLLSTPRFPDVVSGFWAYDEIQEASITHFYESYSVPDQKTGE